MEKPYPPVYHNIPGAHRITRHADAALVTVFSPAAAQPICPTTRRLTVGHLRPSTRPRQRHDAHDAPYIRLLGQWLNAAGFTPGDTITVHVDDGRLVIDKSL